MAQPAFHLAFPVKDIESTRRFFVEVLGCTVGRSAERWIDFNFFGHQVSAHVVDNANFTLAKNEVDGDGVPARHFGVILPPAEWNALADRLRAHGVSFLIEPKVRFVGLPGEQSTMFLLDPSGNALEFKSFQDPDAVFRTA